MSVERDTLDEETLGNAQIVEELADCDHKGAEKMPGDSKWCPRCGAIRFGKQAWLVPSLVAAARCAVDDEPS